MDSRKLALQREALTELTLTDLDAVVGAAATREVTCADSVNVTCELPADVPSAAPAVFYCLTLAGPECIF